MTGDKDFEHDIEFDDLRSSGVDDDEAPIEIDLDGDPPPEEEEELDTGKKKQAAAEEDLDLDALLPPEPEDDERVLRLESQLTVQQLKDRQNQEVTKTKSTVATLETEAADLRTRLLEAREKGDTKAELDLEEKLDEKRLDLREQKRYLTWYESEEFLKRLGEQEAAAPRKDGAEDPATRRRAMREALKAKPVMAGWLNKNRWFMEPKTTEQRAAVALVKALGPELTSKGLSDNDPRYYAEITKHLGKRYPEVVKAQGTDQSSIPVDSGERGGHRRSTGRRVVITPEDKREMRKFGLNPDDPKALREYAGEKAKDLKR